MRDFSSVRERIEPRLGDDPLMADAPTRSRRTPAAEQHQRSEPVSPAQRIIRDVLLESPSAEAVSREAVTPAARPRINRANYEARDAGVRPMPRTNRNAVAGAAPKRRWTWTLSWLNRRFAAVVFVLCLAVGLYWVSEPLAKVFERPIKSVVVEGEFNLITKARATELIGNEIDGDFLQLDLMRIKEALLADPWVEKVTLNRRWPDTLVVKIAEQKPIARWGEGFLNQRGEIVRVDDATKLSGLPWLQGNEADAIEILQQYQDLSQILRSRGLEVLALKCDNKKSWRLTIKNHVEIALGRDQVMEKIRRFVTVYDTKLNGVWADVKAVDLRYSNGVAVRWVADSEMAKKYIKSQSAVDVNVPATRVLRPGSQSANAAITTPN